MMPIAAKAITTSAHEDSLGLADIVLLPPSTPSHEKRCYIKQKVTAEPPSSSPSSTRGDFLRQIQCPNSIRNRQAHGPRDGHPVSRWQRRGGRCQRPCSAARDSGLLSATLQVVVDMRHAVPEAPARQSSAHSHTSKHSLHAASGSGLNRER